MIITHQDNEKLTIYQDIKLLSLSIFAILLFFILITFTNLIPILSFYLPSIGINPLAIIFLILIILYFFYGFFSVTYIFDKKNNSLTIFYSKFYGKRTKKTKLETIESVRFSPFTIYSNLEVNLLNSLTGVSLRHMSGEYTKIMLNSYLFLELGSSESINVRESKEGKRIAEFLGVPFINGFDTNG
jgi:hypothetical protein